MNSKPFKIAFTAFHLVLGIAIFLQSFSEIVRAASGHIVGVMHSHLTIIAAAEALASLLFLVPKMARVGGGILLAIIVFALVVHGIRGELPLLVYAAGVVLVMIEGGTYKM